MDLLVSLLLAATTGASGGDIGATFTLQAQLKQAGQPVDQPADIRASLFDAALSGNQVGSTIQLDNVSVIDGIVVADLDFGAMAFFGESRFIQLEIRVPHDPNNTAPFTPLIGRLPARPTPEAIHAQIASSLRAPVVISGDDANGAIVTVENVAPRPCGPRRVGQRARRAAAGVPGRRGNRQRADAGQRDGEQPDGDGGRVRGRSAGCGNARSRGRRRRGRRLFADNDLDVADDAFVGDNLNVGTDASIGRNLAVTGDTDINGFLSVGTPAPNLFVVDPNTGFTQTRGDISGLGAYFDSQGSRGQQDQFLSSTVNGTLWRDLIVGPLDLKNNAAINIGTGGTSFTPGGGLILNGDLFVGNPTTLAVDATNGLLTLGANKLAASGADGSLNIGLDMFTVNGATGDVFAQRSVQIAVADFLADDFGLTVGPNFEFRVKPDSGDLAIGTGTNDKLAVEAATGNLSIAGFVEPHGGIRDNDNELGDSGQVLASTGSAVRWIEPAHGRRQRELQSDHADRQHDARRRVGRHDHRQRRRDRVRRRAREPGLLRQHRPAGRGGSVPRHHRHRTLWRDLIVGPLDMENFAITNIGSSGASFSGAGGPNLKGELDLGNNGITGIGTANSFFFPDGSLTVRPVLTVQDAQGETTLSVSGSLTSSFVDFTVGLAQFNVDADTRRHVDLRQSLRGE